MGRAPGAHGHLLRVMDIGAALATVTPAKSVVIHAVFSLLLFLLLRLPDDGQASLDGPAVHKERFVSPRVSREPLPSQPQGTHLAKERLQLVAGSNRPTGEETGRIRPIPATVFT